MDHTSQQSDFVQRRSDGSYARVLLTGDWTITNALSLATDLDHAVAGSANGDRPSRLTLDLSEVARIDSSGAWLVHRAIADALSRDAHIRVENVPPSAAALFERVGRLPTSTGDVHPPRRPDPGFVERLGHSVVDACSTSGAFITFIGFWAVTTVRTLLHPRRFRFTSTIHHLEQVGLDAMPIVGLIAFLIGVVLAYQGALQLRLFGAEVYTIDLIAVSVLRELGILLTAIVVAGRTASAYTAQIGSMRVNEEVDALSTIGVEPMEVLVGPRVLALFLALPILTLFANFMGLLGGGVMTWAVLEIDPAIYLQRLREAIDPGSFWVGMVKAPVFGLVIALVGCFEGLQVSSSAESVGRHTTRAVVEAIFMVIVLDALFSVVFGLLGI